MITTTPRIFFFVFLGNPAGADLKKARSGTLHGVTNNSRMQHPNTGFSVLLHFESGCNTYPLDESLRMKYGIGELEMRKTGCDCTLTS